MASRHRSIRPSPRGAILGGLVGTAVMTVLLYMLAPLVMSEPPDIAMMADRASYWLPAMLLHFINGTFTLPLIYAYFVARVLPGRPWQRGALWGLILWALAELLVMPLMGSGPFSEASVRASAALMRACTRPRSSAAQVMRGPKFQVSAPLLPKPANVSA